VSGDFVAQVRELARCARRLAAIGAKLKLEAQHSVRRTEMFEIEAALAGSVPLLDEGAVGALLSTVEMVLTESTELFANPDRAPGWMAEDAATLEAQGRASTAVCERILALAATRPALADALSGQLLDVGTGVGALALHMAERCPDLRIEAIDIWPPALDLARRRIATSEHSTRIAIAHCDVVHLSREPRFSLAWLPTMFMPALTVDQAIARIAGASIDNGWLIAAFYTIPDDPFDAAFARLRTHRSGGEIIDPVPLIAAFRRHGYVDVEIDEGPIATFVLGRLS
jgi:SAM-dependent methyltransferase